MFDELINRYAANVLKTEESSLLGCDVVSLGWWLLIFWRNYSPSKWQKPRTQCQHHILEDLNHYQHCCKISNLTITLTVCFPKINWGLTISLLCEVLTHNSPGLTPTMVLFSRVKFLGTHSAKPADWLPQTLHACLDPFIILKNSVVI